MIDNLKESLLTYIDHLLIYDYMAFGWLILIFLLLLFLSLGILRKKPILALFLIIFDFCFLIIAPFAIKWYLDDKLRPNETETTLIKQLKYSDALIVEGNVTNNSKFDFVTCKTHVDILKDYKNEYKNKLSFINPLIKRSILLKTPPKKAEKVTFRIVISPFEYKADFNVTAYSECY